MRSALTSIGIIIGVGSVIMMIGLGSSAKLAVREQVQSFGANGINIEYANRKIPEKDFLTIKRNYPQVRYISPFLKIRTQPIRNGNTTSTSVVFGVNNDYFYMKEWGILNGRYFLDTEIAGNDNVAIIGSTVQRKLFGYYNPVGKILILNNRTYRIVGSLQETGAMFTGRDSDDSIFIPHTTGFIKYYGDRVLDELYMATYSDTQVTDLVSEIKAYLRSVHNLPAAAQDDFVIETSRDKMKLADSISQTLSYLLAGVASISLFVGGVGIMNIMLVSVSERTREIGIRMAIGAKRRDILLQFVIESMTLSTIGGIVGITLGLIGYLVIVRVLQWSFIFSVFSLFLSVGFSSAIGIFFGFYPARKAAALRPIEALRYE
jgi:putative ABC transport system permease protein